MNLTVNCSLLREKIESFQFNSRSPKLFLALFSAVITFEKKEETEFAFKKAKELKIKPAELYEIILQSYLFLGFPRMLEAAKLFHIAYPEFNPETESEPFEINQTQNWYDRGITLCKDVYKDKYEPLKKIVLSMSPEIFHWMVFEGYGKVLSRKNLSAPVRELSVVAFLMMENREEQLRAHIRGALNVGADKKMLEEVIETIGDAAGEGYSSARKIYEALVR